MLSLSFELNDRSQSRGWLIYLQGRDKPIGEIRYVPDGIRSVPDGTWFGQMSLDGHVVSDCGSTPQSIIDAFEAWVAADMPLGSPLRQWTREKKWASVLSVLDDL